MQQIEEDFGLTGFYMIVNETQMIYYEYKIDFSALGSREALPTELNTNIVYKYIFQLSPYSYNGKNLFGSYKRYEMKYEQMKNEIETNYINNKEYYIGIDLLNIETIKIIYPIMYKALQHFEKAVKMRNSKLQINLRNDEGEFLEYLRRELN